MISLFVIFSTYSNKTFCKSFLLTGALAIKNTVVGFIGFGATLLAKPLIDTVQANGNTFWGFNIHAQQILSAISVILIATAIIYLNTIVKKMKKEI